MSSSNPLHGIIDANRLTSPNFINWLRNLKILLKFEHNAYVLEEDDPIGLALGALEDEI